MLEPQTQRSEESLRQRSLQLWAVARRDYSVVFYGLFLLELLYLLGQQLHHGYSKESWNTTEWLIDYQGGFVRRGLAGEAIYRLSKFFGTSPYYGTLILSLLLYVWLSVYFYRAFCRFGFSKQIMPCVFFLGGPIINDFWFRKDVLMILLFVAMIRLYENGKTRWVVLANIVIVAALLIHETIGFYCFPIITLLLLYRERLHHSRVKAVARTIMTLLIPLAAFVAVLHYRGSFSIARSIWASWSQFSFPVQERAAIAPPGAIDGLTWTLQDGLGVTKAPYSETPAGVYRTLINFGSGIYAPFAWFLIIVLVYFVTANGVTAKRTRAEGAATAGETNLHVVLLFQLCSVTPLFILGWDYWRWIFLWISSSFAIYFIVPQPVLSTIFPNVVIVASRKLDAFCANLFRSFSSSSVWPLLFVIGVPGLYWQIDRYVITTPAYLSIRFASTLIHGCGALMRAFLRH